LVWWLVGVADAVLTRNLDVGLQSNRGN